MGVINVTPDSFSDGGTLMTLEAVAERAAEMAAQGADWLDVGGESTRPGAQPVAEADELARVIPAIAAIRTRCDLPLSVDTAKPAVARAAMAAGATMWNDITALGAGPDSLETAAALGCEVVFMHMKGEPASMQDYPRYEDVLAEVTHFLADRARAAVDPTAKEPGDRLGGSLAVALAAARAGASMVRAHDVRETVQALVVDAAIRG